jgi:NAD(P)-dependent dehydrogenase (short-subunit alcohol dehydrogenase family)
MSTPNNQNFPNSSYLWLLYTQFFPPKASLTESNLPDLTGRVFIVTGGNSGIGEELTRILYQAGGTVYILTRDEGKSNTVISNITSIKTSKSGTIKFIYVDFSDLTTVAPAVNKFLASESRLDVLFNNAGVGGVEASKRTVQGLEMHMGVNVVAPFLLTKLLYPLLTSTAKLPDKKPGSVRVIWTGSIMVDGWSPPGGINVSQLETGSADRVENYSVSKVANWYLASEFHRRNKEEGVVNLVQNPGSLRTNVWRHSKFSEYGILWPFFGKSIDGAHTNLWAGLHSEITIQDGGRYIMPWGRWHPGQRNDIELGRRSESEGGTGAAQRFWEWCEKKVQGFENTQG